MFFGLFFSGASYLRLWVGEVDCDSGVIPLAALYKRTMVCISEINDLLCFLIVFKMRM